MILLVFVTVLFTTLLLTLVMYRQLSEDMRREMNNQAVYIAAGLAAEGNVYLAGIKGEHEDSRITLIDSAGVVLFDNRIPLSELDNHKDRPEVAEALATGRGEAVRMSETVGSQTYYLAIRLPEGTILRIASTTDSVLAALTKSIPVLILIFAVILGLAVFMAKFQTKRIVAPINNLDLENPTENETYDELSPLLLRIYNQNICIDRQIKELRQGKEKFEKITENMAEGLLILDDTGGVLSVNRSALLFLKAKRPAQIGRHYSNLNRSIWLQKVAETALTGQSVEELFTSDLSHYQLRATPIVEDGKSKGVLVLILDVTEKQKAEKIRREFSANVSHELKTPLTAISGFAELMKNNLVKQEDIPVFSAKIYEEAIRMIHLIEDVIRLSQLDEKNVPLAMEKMNLLAVAQNVGVRLSSLADQKGVSFSVQGEAAYIKGVPQLIDELITNLVDNAIKYNREQGTVSITVSEGPEKVLLAVADTGIGISAADKERIFERFYRVDKSRSKDTGGTGLGLSIVKHIAGYHKAQVEIESTVGKGTKIVVSFPKPA
jgi:two-component system phosphate regulon sensor histidine kinase PhoR